VLKIIKIKDIIGKTFKNNLNQEFKVLSFEYIKKTEYYFKVQFLDTLSVYTKDHRAISKGSVKDSYSKTIYSVACKGDVSSKYPVFNKIAFKRWYAMIERCYNVNASSYNGYGKKGVIVHERWLCFENFLTDINKISGFDKNLFLSGKIQLDKDLKNKDNNMYSKENCMFVDSRINKRYQPSKHTLFLAISPENKKYLYDSFIICSEENSLTESSIRKVIDDNYKMYNHKGWKFAVMNKNVDLKKYIKDNKIINRSRLCSNY
jgi:hypothetical protein